MSDATDRIAALEAQLHALQGELETLKATQGAEPAEASRRDVFRKLAIGAAGAAVAGAGVLATAGPAAAADGNNVVLGQVNSSTAATTANNNGAANIGVAYLFQSGSTWNASDASFPAALGGWAGASGNATNGVYGYTQKPNGYGVVAVGVLNAATVGARLQGGRAGAQMVSSGTVAAVTAAAHELGDVILTSDGSLWFCAAAGTPGTLRKLSGPTTAGQLHLLDAPVRVYDSRSGDGPLSSGTPSRAVSLTSGLVGGATTPAVPAGATGALVSLTVTRTAGSGFAAVFSNAVAWPGSSNINWSAANQDIAVTTVSAVDASAKVKVQAGGGAGFGTDFILDVIGYYQ